MINSIKARNNNRRKNQRRGHSRRVIPYAFGSEEWLNKIKKYYLLWPKKDRRQQERRCLNRRSAVSNHHRWHYRLASTHHDSREGLTDAEKMMLGF